MSPRLNLTSLSDTIFRSLFRVLFRYDIFISYARGDGKEYAVKLRDQLKQLDFSCFLDFDELPAGNSLNNTLKRAIRKSATLVVVGTERAVKSRYVELEVGEFAGTGRAIIPIDIEGTLADTPWSVIKERDIVWIDEVKSALTKGVPSPSVADSIDKLFKYTRRNSRVRAQVLSTIVLFVVVVVAALFMIRQQVNAATLASAKAERETIEATKQKTLADAATVEADKQRKAADEALNNAKIAKGEAEVASNKAMKAEKAASEATKEAKRQEQIALTNAERAKAEQARAEERTRYVLAQQTGVHADLARASGDDLDRSVLLSLESLKRALTPEGYSAWERGMDQLPHPLESQFAPTGKHVSTIAYSPDGNLFAQGSSQGTVRLSQTNHPGLDVELQPKLTNRVKVVTFGRDGSWVAAANEREVRVWATKTHKLMKDMQIETGDGCCADSIAISPDGRYVAMGGPSTKSLVRVLDLINSSLVVDTQLELVNYVMGVAFSPNGKWLAVSFHSRADGPNVVGKVVLWDVATFDKGVKGTPPAVASVIDKELFGRVVFSPQGHYFATPSSNGMRMWSMSLDEGPIRISKVEQTPGIHGFALMAFSPDEKNIAAAWNKKTTVWEVDTGREISNIQYQESIEDLVFSPDGKLLATASDEVKVWKMESGSAAGRIPIHDKSSEQKLSTIAVSPGGEWLATGSSDGVRVFKATGWAPVVTLAEAGKVFQLTFDSSGRWLIATSETKVTIFDTKQWKSVKVIPSGKANVGFSSNARWLAVWTGSALKLFEYGTWREVFTLNHIDPVATVFFSFDGRWMDVNTVGRFQWASHHGYDVRKRTYVWDTNKGSLAACMTDTGAYSQNQITDEESRSRGDLCPEVKGNQQPALLSEVPNWKEALTFDVQSVTADGLWSADGQGSSIVLSLKEGNTSRQVASFTPGGSARYFTFTPDSRWLVIADDREITRWPLKPADMIDEACSRLRRRDLTLDEWKQYFSGEKLQPTCPVSQR